MTKNNKHQDFIQKLPSLPGIYKYFDIQNKLIYVGKAKNLKKRVSSYFNKHIPNFKTYELVRKIERIEFTIVDTEQDAFLLENALIKQFQPKYNILLKDDKSYPYIVIKKEPFPRVFLSRKKVKDGSEYIGPFTNLTKVKEILQFIKQTIPLRSCKLNLSAHNIAKGKLKVCLEYHLGNCLGPCEGLQTENDYQSSLVRVKQIIKGNLQPLLLQLKEEMLQHAEKLAFEKAEIIKRKIIGLENYQSRSVIVSQTIGDVDIFSIIKNQDHAFVNYLIVHNGTIVNAHTVELSSAIANEEEVLLFAIQQLREKFNSHAPEIIVPFPIAINDPTIKITIPKVGDKKKLLELSQKNVDYYLERLKKKSILQLEEHDDMRQKKVLYQIQKDLQLSNLPAHIECFDNSNFHGSYPVSAMVCFKNGQPSKKDYRHFNVKTIKGINDFATMQEVVYRRYARLKEEQQPLPQLIIIDGGKGQLNYALQALKKLDLHDKIAIIGLAKNEEEIFFPHQSTSLKLPWDSPSLLLIRRIRDEVHRFGITFHRQQRSKGTFKNELEQIPGIGTHTAQQLLKRFKSVAQIKLLTERELTAEIGASKAKKVWQYFHTQKL